MFHPITGIYPNEDSGSGSSGLELLLLLGFAPGAGGGEFTIGGTVNGLSTDGLVLQNNGGDDLSVASGATDFTFGSLLADGAPFDVTVSADPTDSGCLLSDASGSVSGSNVTGVTLDCFIAPGLGTSQYFDISAGTGVGSGDEPSTVIDTISQKLVAITENADNNNAPGFFRCDLDGSNCAHVDLIASGGFTAMQGADSGFDPSAVLDTTNSKILIAANSTNGTVPLQGLAVWVCSLDGTTCTRTDVSAATGQGTSSGITPSIAIDSASSKLIVVTEQGNNGSRPGFFRCNLDASGCTYADISAGEGANSGRTPEIVVDSVNSKLLAVVTNSSSGMANLGVFRCDLDGTSCSHTDVCALSGQGTNCANRPSTVIDTLNNKLLIAGANSNNANALSVYRCDLDISSCSHTDVGAATGYTGNRGRQSSIAVEYLTNKLLVVTRDNGSTPANKPTLYRCNLDVSGCTATDISAGQGMDSGKKPSIAVDTINYNLIVVTTNGDNFDRPALYIK